MEDDRAPSPAFVSLTKTYLVYEGQSQRNWDPSEAMGLWEKWIRFIP
jgi:hypothetical protein